MLLFVGVGIIALFSFFFVLGFFCFRTANYRHKSYPAERHAHGGGSPLTEDGTRLLEEALKWWGSQAFEEVGVTACDGIALGGLLLEADDPRGVVVLFHGYHSSCKRDLAPQVRWLHEAGYHVLLVSQRAHGASEGKYICFGAREREDVRVWCGAVRTRYGDLPIGLMGLSMGASTVVFSCEGPSIPGVRCVVADCGFTTPWEIIYRRLWRKHRIVPFPVIYFMNYWSRMLAGFDYRQCSAEEIVSHTTLPILLFHGTADTYVPIEMSKRIAAANPRQVRLISIPDAPHAQGVYYAPEQYRRELLTFLEQSMT